MKTVTKFSLRTWVIVMALAPTIVVGLLLGTYFTSNRFSELEQTLLKQGANIIEPLALASEYGLFNNDREYTKRLIDRAQLQNAGLVQAIAVFDVDNQIVASSKYHHNLNQMKISDQRTLISDSTSENLGDTLILRAPVVSDNPLLVHSAQIDATRLGYIAMLMNKHEALLQQYRAAGIAFIIVLIGVQLNLLFTFRLLKNVTNPISQMVLAVAKIREGRLETRLDGDLIGELDSLKRGINAMAASLAEYHNEMQQNIDQATSDLRETLEQIEIQNVELDLAKKRALEASRIKSEFLANMSHELRTPLNGVIGFARQLLKTPLKHNQRDHIKTIERSATSLLSIIDDILDFSKLEAGKMILNPTPFALRDTLDETLTLLSGNAYEKGLELVVDIDNKIPDALLGDAMRIQQIVTNLVGNAIKFTHEGSVNFSLELVDTHGDRIRLRSEISDTGPGVPEEQQSQLFQPFGQADSTITRRFGGTGLGLVITKRLVNQMEGQIGFTSQAGQGTTFWFTLGLERTPFAINEVIPAQKLETKPVLVFEPRRLSRRALVRLLDHWQLSHMLANRAEQIEESFNEQSELGYVLLSCRGLNSDVLLSKILPSANRRNVKVVLMYESQPPAWCRPFVEQEQVQLVAYPLSQGRLFTAMMGMDGATTAFEAEMEVTFEPTNHGKNNVAPTFVDRRRKPLRALAVDDNAANLKLISALLEELITHVDCAPGGQQAIKLAREHEYDLIFMDIQMPDVDGIMATTKIRNQSLNRHTPIIAVTAHVMPEERRQFLASGLDDCLTKPIDEQQLASVLERWGGSGEQVTSGDNGVIDWPLAITQAGGKEELARDMLFMLLESIAEAREKLEAHPDDATLAKVIHKLHSATCYSGVPSLQKLCAQIETALKGGTPPIQLQPELLELMDELNHVEIAARNHLAV